MVARGFSRRAGRRGRKRLGYTYKGCQGSLKSKTLTGTLRTTVGVVADPEQPGVQYRCSRLRASAASEAALLGSVARACRRSRRTLAMFTQCPAAGRWRERSTGSRFAARLPAQFGLEY